MMFKVLCIVAVTIACVSAAAIDTDKKPIDEPKPIDSSESLEQSENVWPGYYPAVRTVGNYYNAYPYANAYGAWGYPAVASAYNAFPYNAWTYPAASTLRAYGTYPYWHL